MNLFLQTLFQDLFAAEQRLTEHRKDKNQIQVTPEWYGARDNIKATVAMKGKDDVDLGGNILPALTVMETAIIRAERSESQYLIKVLQTDIDQKRVMIENYMDAHYKGSMPDE